MVSTQKYPEYQAGREVIYNNSTYSIIKRDGDMLFLHITGGLSGVYIKLLDDSLVPFLKLVPLKESPMAWLKDGVEYWVFDSSVHRYSADRTTFCETASIHQERKRLGLAWPTKEACEAWVKEQEEKNK